MADFDPSLHTSQDFDPELHTIAPPEKPKSMVSKLGTAALHGAGAELTGVLGKTLALAATTPFIAADKVRGMVSGQPETGAQDWAFSNMVDPLSRAAESFAPTAEEAASIPLSIAHGLGSMAVDLPLIAYTGGKVGVPAAASAAKRAVGGMVSMAPVAVAHGVAQTDNALQQGVDLPTAYESGAVSTLSTAAMGAVPLAMRGGITKRAVTGAASGVATGEASRVAQNAVMSDRPDLQTEMNAKDMAVAASTGALLGAILGPRPEKIKINKALEEAKADVAAGEPLQLGYTNSPNGDPTVKIGFQDGSASTQAEFEAYLKSLPDDAARMAARAKVFGIPTEQTDVLEESQVARIPQRLAEAARQESGLAPMPLPESQAHARALDLLRDSGEISTGTADGDINRAIELHGNPDGAPAPEAGISAQARDAQVEALWADRARQQEAVAQAARDADFNKAQAQAAEDNAARADALTRAQGFGEREPTAIELAMKTAADKFAAEAPARERAAAEAIEAQRLKDIANPPAKPIEHYASTLAQVLPDAYPGAAEKAGKAITTKVTNSLAKAFEGKNLESEQLEAVAKLRDAAPKGGVLESIYGTLHSKLTEGKATPDEKPTEAKATEVVQAEAQGPEVPVAAPASARYEALKSKLQDQGLSNEEAAEMRRLDPQYPSDAAVAKKAAELGVPEQFLKDRPGFWSADKQSWKVSDAYIGAAHKVDVATSALHRAYGDFTRANSARVEIEDSVAADPKFQKYLGHNVDATPLHEEVARRMQEDADRINNARATEGSFENLLAQKRSTERLTETSRAMDKVSKQEIATEAKHLDQLTREGFVSPEEHARLTEAMGKAKDSMDLADVLSDASDKAQKLKDSIEKTKQQPAANDATSTPKELTAKEQLQQAADRLTATLADFTLRVRSGEALSEAEQARFKSAQEFAGAIERTKNPNKRPEMDAYLRELAAMADDHTTPEGFIKHQELMSRKISSTDPNAEAFRPDLEGVVGQGGTVKDTLAHLKENGSTQEVKDTAKLLESIGLKTTLSSGDLTGFLKNAVGGYNTRLDQIVIAPGKASEATVLHEIVHAAAMDRVKQAEAIERPRNQSEAKLKQAYADLKRVMFEAMQLKGEADHYGLTDAHEFLAELKSNPAFRDFLQNAPKASLFDRAVDAIRKLLGLSVESKSLLERALSLEGDFIGKEQYEEAKKFAATPKGAAEVTDNTLSYLARHADTAGDKVDWGTLGHAVFKTMARWKTTQYIADRVRAIPEQRQAGMSKAVDLYEATYQVRNTANRFAEAPAAKFADGVQKMLRGMGDPARAQEVSNKMSEIAVGSSIGGFDPTMNFDANLRVRPDLSPTNKAFIDGIYRQFQSLKSTDPAAARAIVEGAQVNRRSYVMDAATVISNLLDARLGNTRRLEAELQRMDPLDANRARLEARIQASTRESNLTVNHAAGLDFMSKDVQHARNGDSGKHLDGTSYILDQRIKAVFADANALPEGSPLRDQLREMEGKYKNQIDNPYYHAGRSGDYFVKVGFKDMDAQTWTRMQDALKGTNKLLGDYTNQTHAFFRVETREQANALHDKMLNAGGSKIVMGESARGKLAEAGQISNNAGISAALRSVLATLHDTVESNPGLNPEQAAMMKEAMTRKFLSMLPESSTRLATIKRMGVPGYDGDFLGVFARRAAGGIQDTANIYAMRGYSEAFKGMEAAVGTLARSGDIDNQIRAQVVRDEITTRYANSMKPVGNTQVNLLNSLSHSFYLGLSPAFFIRTMAQPWHRGVPHLGSRYGFVATAKEMAGATSAAMKIVSATIKNGWDGNGVRGLADAEMSFKDLGLTPREEAFIQELHDRGDLDLGQSRQLQRMAIGGSQKMQDAVRLTAMTAQYAEMSNRLIVGLAAFRLAERGKAGVPQKGAAANTEYALKAIKYTMDDFNENNTARAIGKHGVAGEVTPLMSSFMNYNFQTMQQLARTVHDGMFNHDQSPEGMQRAKEARRELAGVMATTTMISGAMGLPFVNAFAGVYNMLTKDEDDPSDIRMHVRNFLADKFGVEGGEFAAHGVGSLLGVDTSSFGLQNLLPGTEFLASRRLMKDRLAETSQGLLGPALNAGMDIAQALSMMSDGQYVKGIAQAVPSGLKGYVKAADMAARGYTDAKGNPIALETTPWQIAVQATGLRPSVRAEQAEAANYINTDATLRDHRKGVLKDQFYKAVTGQDAAGTQAVVEDLRRFNAKNPMEPITDLRSVFAQRATALGVGVASGTGVSAQKKKLPILQQQLRFVNNGAMPQN